MDVIFNSFPLNGSPTSQFTTITDPTGKFLVTSEAERITWANIINALQAAGFIDEVFVNAGSGITVSGSGTEGDPFVIAATGAGSGTGSVVVVDNLAALQGVGNENTVYFVRDTDGSGTNGVYFWNTTTSQYESAGGSSTGTSASRSDVSATGLTGKVKHVGTAPTLTGSAGSYSLSVAAGVDLQGFRLTAASGPTATDGSQNLTLDIVNADSDFEYGTFQVIDGNTNQIVDLAAFGITITVTEPSAGTLRHVFANIGGFTSFKILFSPCA